MLFYVLLLFYDFQNSYYKVDLKIGISGMALEIMSEIV